MRTENWCGYEIRFVEHEGAWYAVLKDICDALGLRTDNTKMRIDEVHLTKLAINTAYSWTGHDPYDKGFMSVASERTSHMLCVDEAGIYQALSRSTRLEARKFIDWMSHSMVSLRKAIGLEGYEALKLTESTIQEAISKKVDIPYVKPTGDIIPVKAEPTVVNNYISNVDYRKVVIYGVLGGVSAVAVCAGVVYIVKRVKAKKAKKKAN